MLTESVRGPKRSIPRRREGSQFLLWCWERVTASRHICFSAGWCQEGRYRRCTWIWWVFIKRNLMSQRLNLKMKGVFIMRDFCQSHGSACCWQQYQHNIWKTTVIFFISSLCFSSFYENNNKMIIKNKKTLGDVRPNSFKGFWMMKEGPNKGMHSQQRRWHQRPTSWCYTCKMKISPFVWLISVPWTQNTILTQFICLVFQFFDYILKNYQLTIQSHLHDFIIRGFGFLIEE